MARTGRPKKLNKKLIEELCEWIGQGMTNVDACNLCNIRESALYYWLQKDREGKGERLEHDLSVALKKAQSEFKATHIKHILEASKDTKHWQASAWMLERKYPKEYGRKDRNSSDQVDDNGMLDQMLDLMQKEKGEQDE